MYKNNKLTIGKTYTTEDGLSVIPIAIMNDNEALFTTDQFPITPFVIWTYDRKTSEGDNTISLYRGKYYPTLESALIDQHPEFQPWCFRVTYFCKHCGTEHIHTIYVDACKPVQDIIEEFEDLRVCPDCGIPTNRTIKRLALEQSYNYYNLPLTC